MLLDLNGLLLLLLLLAVGVCVTGVRLWGRAEQQQDVRGYVWRVRCCCCDHRCMLLATVPAGSRCNAMCISVRMYLHLLHTPSCTRQHNCRLQVHLLLLLLLLLSALPGCAAGISAENQWQIICTNALCDQFVGGWLL
jgi:hypothetical protein